MWMPSMGIWARVYRWPCSLHCLHSQQEDPGGTGCLGGDSSLSFPLTAVPPLSSLLPRQHLPYRPLPAHSAVSTPRGPWSSSPGHVSHLNLFCSFLFFLAHHRSPLNTKSQAQPGPMAALSPLWQGPGISAVQQPPAGSRVQTGLSVPGRG